MPGVEPHGCVGPDAAREVQLLVVDDRDHARSGRPAAKRRVASYGRTACARPCRTSVSGLTPSRFRCARPVGAGTVACAENTSSKLSRRARGRRTPPCGAAAAAARRPAARGRVAEPARARRPRSRQRVDGRVLESVEAVGKNLLLRFEGGLVVRSHLRMTGRWRIEPRGKARTRPAVARAPRRDARGRALERAGAHARDAEPPAARSRTCSRTSSTSTPPSRGCAAPATRGSARRSRTSGSSPGSGTCGWPRRSGRSASRRGARVRDARRRRAARRRRDGAHG